MKTLYLPGQYPFCYYYRGYLPGIYGNQLVVSDFMRRDMKYSAEKVTEQADKADVIVFQRPTDRKSYDLALLLKRKGKKIIFENDDTYDGIPLERLNNEKEVAVAKELSRNLTDFLKIADGAIASTEVLADEYRKINPNVAVLKNCIDPMDAFRCKENKTGKFRIGIIGSVTSNDDYEHIKDDLRKLGERNDITLVVLGVKQADGKVMKTMQPDADFWGSLKNVEWHPYCHVTEYMGTIADLALDLAIIPRKDHYFNRCKSNLKFLEMSLLRIPVMAQGMEGGPYEKDKHLIRMYAEDSWYREIIIQKNSPDFRKEMARKAHEYVLENYNIKKYAQEWANQIQILCK